MLDFSHIPTGWNSTDIQIFSGMGSSAGECWQTWQKPRGKKMCQILLVGRGGNGGTGVIGANSAAAGGGGGASGGQSGITLPLSFLPDTLYLTLAGVSTNTAVHSYICLAPKLTAGPGQPIANDTLIMANGGSNGGNASAGTAGTAGTAAPAATAAGMPLGYMFRTTGNSVIAGQAGAVGGAAVGGGNITLPTDGLFVTGGGGGAGLPAAATNGGNGGVILAAGVFLGLGNALGGNAATTPPMNGPSGLRPIPNMLYGYGGCGAGATHGSATGAGLVQASGGDGAPGCGGGGMGGALTGSTPGRIGMGGPAYCIIVVW